MNNYNSNNKNNSCKNKYKINSIYNSLKEVECFLSQSKKIISLSKISILLKNLFKWYFFR